MLSCLSAASCAFTSAPGPEFGPALQCEVLECNGVAKLKQQSFCVSLLTLLQWLFQEESQASVPCKRNDATAACWASSCNISVCMF